MQSILLIELKGLTDMATAMASKMEACGITPERVRAAMLDVLSDVLDACAELVPVERRERAGGDTWHITFDQYKDALTFGSAVLDRCLMRVTESGLYYLKPSLAVILGKPALQEHWFLDDASITAFRGADGGEPFTLSLFGDAIVAARMEALKTAAAPAIRGHAREYLDWRFYIEGRQKRDDKAVRVPALLLDGDILYSQSPAEVIDQLLSALADSRKVRAFGGPIQLVEPFLLYLRRALEMLRAPAGPEISVLSYIPHHEPGITFAWFTLCSRIAELYPRFRFQAYLASNPIRPFSFHVFDTRAVHIGLRTYSEVRQKATLSKAIMFRSERIANLFVAEFEELGRAGGSSPALRPKDVLEHLQIKRSSATAKKAVAAAKEFLAEAGGEVG